MKVIQNQRLTGIVCLKVFDGANKQLTLFYVVANENIEMIIGENTMLAWKTGIELDPY